MEPSIFPDHDEKIRGDRVKKRCRALFKRNVLPDIYEGDCIEIMKEEFEDESIDVVVTSPPYNLNIKYAKYKDKKPQEKYLFWLSDVFAEIKRVLKPDGSFFLNVGYSNKQPWISEEVAFVAKPLFALQNKIIWAKSLTMEKDGREIGFGHFKPINSPRFINCLYENLYHFTKTGNIKLDRLSIGVKYVDSSNVERWKSADKARCRGNIWCIPYDTILSKIDKGDHPAVFPPRLAEWAIRLHGIEYGMKVLDPFMGTGSTLKACVDLGVMSSGIDIDPQYIEYAKKRIFENE